MTIEEVKARIEKLKAAPSAGTYAASGSAADCLHRAWHWRELLADAIFDYFNLLLGGNDDGLTLLDDISTDHYDNSIELHGVKPSTAISEELRQAIKELGFDRYWINFTDGTEQYCSGPPTKKV